MRTLLVALLLIAAAAAAVWLFAPQYIPAEWRTALDRDPRDDPDSPRYAPKVYRWRDAAGVLQLTDTPPTDRPFEEVRINPDTNVVPSTLPVGQELPAPADDE